MSESVCFILGLLLWTRAGGSHSQARFTQTNKDLQLTVTEEVQIGEDLFYWKFNNIKNIARLHDNKSFIFSDYKGSVEFFPEDLSLVLKNVQLSDSGTYTAVVSGSKDVTHASYDVTVQAPVSPVSVKVDSVSFSPESCNFTVSCTTELSPSISRSFTCDRHTCEEASPAPSDPAPSLHLYLSDVSIICNHSNHVSWRNDTKDKRQVCPFGAEEVCAQETEPERSWCLVKTVVFSVGLLLMVSSVITVHVLDWTRKKHN